MMYNHLCISYCCVMSFASVTGREDLPYLFLFLYETSLGKLNVKCTYV